MSGTTNGIGPHVGAPSGTGVQGSADSGTGGAFFASQGQGVYGQSETTASTLVPVTNGVHGITDSPQGYGVIGENYAGGTAVFGIGGDFGVAGSGVVGVVGVGDGNAGVRGENSGSGSGVHGDTFNGIGVLATGATALSVHGPAVFSRSGVMTVRAGRSSAVHTVVPLTRASLVLATLQQDVDGVWVRSAVPDPAGNTFTVHLNKAAPTPVKVAWFVVN